MQTEMKQEAAYQNERGMNERIKKLRYQSTTTDPHISIERAKLYTEAYKMYEGTVPTPMLRALSFKYFMENRTLCINDGELIVGEKGIGAQSTPTFPELCCHTIDDFEVMDQRKYISFKVDEETRKYQEEVIIPFWEGRQVRKKLISRMTPEWRAAYENGIFTEFMEQRAPGHTCMDGKIYVKGMVDFKKDIKAAIDTLDMTEAGTLQRRNQLEAMDVCCDAMVIYGQRYAAFARDMAEQTEDSQRKAELLQIAENCEVVPAHAPKTFQQAIQMYWFVHIGVTTELNIWDAMSPGRLDQHLIPFYKRDTAEGVLTRDHAKELLENMWVKFNNQPAPPKVGITLKESGTYTDFANINTGGIAPDGSNGVNDVSYLILEVMDEMKLLQPSSNVQISKKTPDDFLIKACEVSSRGWGQPAFYNTDAIVEELLRAGKSIEDARQGGATGCVETGAFGKEAYILTGYMNLPKIFEMTLFQGKDMRTGLQLGPMTSHPDTWESFDDLMEAYKAQVTHFVDIKVRGNAVIEQLYATEMPAPFISVVIDDCITKGLDYNAGGARYNTTYIQGVGIGTLTDSLTAIDTLVFREKKSTMAEYCNALLTDFESNPRLRLLAMNKTPKYGNDDDYADAMMLRAFNLYYDIVNGRKNAKGGFYRINMLPTTCHVYFGAVTLASPDGRASGKPLSEGISPAKGGDRLGPTAVIRSAAKMDHLRTGGTLLNQKFLPSAIESKGGLEKLGALVRAYFRMDGHHIQFNVVEKALLLEAQGNPDEFKDLIVRVAGYSDYFNNLDRALQDEIIERTEQVF